MSDQAPEAVPTAKSAGPEQAGPERSAHDGGLGRARLRRAMLARPSRGQLVAGLLCALLGFAVAVQVRANQDSRLSGLRQTDLVSILDDVTARAARLQAEARDLEDTKARVSGGSTGSRAALAEARERSRTLGILAGSLPAEGPGIEFTITAPDNQVGADVLLDTLQELRDAGGEVFEFGQPAGPNVRVIASTYISDAEGRGIVVDGVGLEPPYRIRVIGDSRTLGGALNIPGGVLDVLSQNDAQGTVTQRTDVLITSLRAAPEPEYARPAPEKSG